MKQKEFAENLPMETPKVGKEKARVNFMMC